MKRARRNIHFLSNFSKFNKQQQKSLLKNIDIDQIKFFCELTYNFLIGNIKVDKSTKDKLKAHKNKIRKLACKSCPLKTKRKLIQVGGFVPILLSTLGSTALSLLMDHMSKNGERKN